MSGGASKKAWPAAYSLGLRRSNSFSPGLPPESACTDTDTDDGPSGNLLSEPSMSTPIPCSRYPYNAASDSESSVSQQLVVKPCESTLAVALPTVW